MDVIYQNAENSILDFFDKNLFNLNG